jgi:hypothetical protein
MASAFPDRLSIDSCDVVQSLAQPPLNLRVRQEQWRESRCLELNVENVNEMNRSPKLSRQGLGIFERLK